MAGFHASLLLSLVPLAAPQDHAARAQRWLERASIEATESTSVEDVLRQGFVVLELGLFDAMFPVASVHSGDAAAHLQEVARALVALQREWNAWLPGGDRELAGELEEDGEVLAGWIDSWKEKEVRAAGVDPDGEGTRRFDLFEATRAKDEAREAAERFARNMRAGGAVTTREPAEGVRLLLLPTREEFVELLALVGKLEPRHTPHFWVAGCETWLCFDFDGVRALALEYATPDAASDYKRSIPMADRNPKALGENVAQLAARSLLEALVPPMEPMLAAGIANDLVISVFGEVDTRTDGDPRSRTTQERSVFIPGGNPTGGTLPANDASSRWRRTKGAGWFADVLAQAQEQASGAAGEKWQKIAGVELRDDAESSSVVLHAPFLGAGSATPAPEFRGDHAEFLRAYRACFLHWLRTAGAGSPKASREAFAALLRGIAADRAPLPDLLDEIYGVPLSADTGEELFRRKDTPLEGAFLTWLSKQ